MESRVRNAASDVALFERVARVLAAHDDTVRALEEILESVSSALGVAAAWIWLVDPDTSRFYLAASRGLPPFLQEPIEMTGEPCWCIEAFVDGDFVSKNVRTIDCSRLRRAERADRSELAGGLKYHASVVLRFGERQLGILNLSRADWHALSPEDLAMLAALGSQIGLALERSRLALAASALARSDERTRLAREIHDTLAQDFTAIGLQLEGSLRALDSEPALARERIETALGVARRSLDDARSAMTTLRSDPLGGRPLALALAALSRSFASENGILTGFRDEAPFAVPYAIECELYRIASEALENVRKHARARRVELRLSSDEARVELTIEDDGIGATGRTTGGSFGIIGMTERVRTFGGTVVVGRSESTGTRVVARVPFAS